MRPHPRTGLLALLALMGLLLTSVPAAAQTAPTTPDRYGTAAQAAFDAFPAGADVAVLASGEDFADALAAAPLAAAFDAPVLLTGRTVLPPATAAALAELGVADVLVMGGTAAVGVEVTNGLELDYQVSRVAGADRYGTAARAALDAFPDGADVAVLASGEGFADALAAAPLAAAYDAPILLTSRNSTPAVTLAALAELEVADVLVMGGTAAVGTAVSNGLELDYQVSRVAGADRYGTAAQAAQDAFPTGAAVAVLASGEDFPDALAAAPLAAAYDAPILLTGRNATPEVTLGALAELGVADVLVLGGPAAISTEVTNRLELTYQVSRIAGGSSELLAVEVFFANTGLGDPCGGVFPVSRTVAAAAPLQPTLEALLAGPSAAEQALGYEGWFSAETEGLLRDVRVESGVAHVDFATQLRLVIPNASTSCGSAGLLAQLDRTVTQFPTVDEARFSLGGDETAFYEWLQLVPPT